MKPHYFFAIVIPDDMKKAIFHEMKQHQLPFKKFTHPEDYHITLAFIGDSEERLLEEVCAQLEESLKETHSFPLRLTSFYTFGLPASPRIFWIGTDEPRELYQLQSITVNVCTKAGFKLDERPYRPHLTTARKWKGDKPYKPVVAPEWNNITINEVALYETNRLEEPKYTKKWSYLLNETRED
ncbi:MULTISPECIES: RNA 2',3'-cyclic phosphodiesterase [Bacillaceae]|uniref:RNA 2',3'-cyclic phosphodiesterase n=1 Tax=Domibacillus aminovorans TaxID=29332 RepID=A0A177KSE6_9BACI|nr:MULTISPECIES: RNA 2',3'-cyclic phosphodiesterase [Bacillaceae]OAH56258.1 hypothetical protein AWH48_06205 [Domibacillus aminovorans]